ncbi:hypothetical protein SLS62_004364 [Diatrype stigma]|uniref:Uncharacterized protein n=1 Tax=Diatrype stigma TaxID=117547 RepID=A0AAN9YTT6_9PEZI
MSVELGTDSMLMKQASAYASPNNSKRGSRHRKRNKQQDVAGRAWREKQIRTLAQTWNTEVEDIVESFPQPIVYKGFLEQLLLSARYYPRNVLVPLIQEAQEERSRGLRRTAGRSSSNNNNNKGAVAAKELECFLPCDVTRALERAREALRESEVLWHPKTPPPCEVEPKAEPMGGTFAPVTPSYTQEHITGVDGQENTRNTSCKGQNINVHQPLRNDVECHGVLHSTSKSEAGGSMPSDDNDDDEDAYLAGLTCEASQQRSKNNRDRNDESDDSDAFLLRPLKRRRHHWSGGARLVAAAASASSPQLQPEEEEEQEQEEEDQDHHQPDAVAPAGLTAASDDPKVRDVIQTLEGDPTLCHKMRWYVARHVRREYQAGLSPSRQTYRRRIGEHRRTSAGRTWAVGLPDRPFNRLDFEATRAQVGFRRGQEGWERQTITRILQSAYERYGWCEVIAGEEVDGVLLEAGADLTLWDDLEEHSAATAAQKKKGEGDKESQLVTRGRRQVTTPPPTPPNHHQGSPIEIIEIESSPEPSPPSCYPADSAAEKNSSWGSFVASSSGAQSSTNKSTATKKRGRGTTSVDDDDPPPPALISTPPASRGVNSDSRKPALQDGGKGKEWQEWPPLPQKVKSSQELTVLWAEVEQLKAQAERDRLAKERLIRDQKAAQGALLAEMRLLREAAEKERARCWNQKRLKRRRNDRRMRRYLRKLKELEAEVEELSSELSSPSCSSSSSSSDEDPTSTASSE